MLRCESKRVVNHADLRTVAVSDDDVVAFSNHVNDAGCSVLYELKLFLGRIAQGIAAQRDDNTLSI